MRKNKSGT